MPSREHGQWNGFNGMPAFLDAPECWQGNASYLFNYFILFNMTYFLYFPSQNFQIFKQLSMYRVEFIEIKFIYLIKFTF